MWQIIIDVVKVSSHKSLIRKVLTHLKYSMDFRVLIWWMDVEIASKKLPDMTVLQGFIDQFSVKDMELGVAAETCIQSVLLMAESSAIPDSLQQILTEILATDVNSVSIECLSEYLYHLLPDDMWLNLRTGQSTAVKAVINDCFGIQNPDLCVTLFKLRIGMVSSLDACKKCTDALKNLTAESDREKLLNGHLINVIARKVEEIYEQKCIAKIEKEPGYNVGAEPNVRGHIRKLMSILPALQIVVPDLTSDSACRMFVEVMSCNVQESTFWERYLLSATGLTQEFNADSGFVVISNFLKSLEKSSEVSESDKLANSKIECLMNHIIIYPGKLFDLYQQCDVMLSTLRVEDMRVEIVTKLSSNIVAQYHRIYQKPKMLKLIEVVNLINNEVKVDMYNDILELQRLLESIYLKLPFNKRVSEYKSALNIISETNADLSEQRLKLKELLEEYRNEVCKVTYAPKEQSELKKKVERFNEIPSSENLLLMFKTAVDILLLAASSKEKKSKNKEELISAAKLCINKCAIIFQQNAFTFRELFEINEDLMKLRDKSLSEMVRTDILRNLESCYTSCITRVTENYFTQSKRCADNKEKQIENLKCDVMKFCGDIVNGTNSIVEPQKAIDEIETRLERLDHGLSVKGIDSTAALQEVLETLKSEVTQLSLDRDFIVKTMHVVEKVVNKHLSDLLKITYPTNDQNLKKLILNVNENPSMPEALIELTKYCIKRLKNIEEQTQKSKELFSIF